MIKSFDKNDSSSPTLFKAKTFSIHTNQYELFLTNQVTQIFLLHNLQIIQLVSNPLIDFP